MNISLAEKKGVLGNKISKLEVLALVLKYHPCEASVLEASRHFSVEKFIRLFVTAHGMQPKGIWLTHTYARYRDSETKLEHFLLIPMPQGNLNDRPNIRFEGECLFIDNLQTNIRRQSIPHTTPFWYFHYNPNRENNPYYSMTLNLSPSCIERCVLCAGAKTGRVNNGMDDTLSSQSTINKIFRQHPQAAQQLDSVAIVTGCFSGFDEMCSHLKEVKQTISDVSSATTFRVLEHNVVTEEQFQKVVGELGYDVFVTLECFDQAIRNIALNGKVGRKGRNSQEFITILKNYAHYLEARPELGKHLVRVTYLMGLDSLEITEHFFQEIAAINKQLKHTTILPWLSIFTAYNKAMKGLQQKDFGLDFLLRGMKLCEKYFDKEMLQTLSGGTSDGYARGFY